MKAALSQVDKHGDPMNTFKTRQFFGETYFEKNNNDERYSLDGNPTISSAERASSYLSQEKFGKIGAVASVDIGSTDIERRKVIQGLSNLLADTYVLYLKTQNYHWNVTGPHFFSLHTMFMNQYVELASAVDLIAERIRMLGQPAPATFLEFAELAIVKEQRGVQSAEKMLTTLNDDQEILMRTIRNTNPIAEKCRDYTTVDLLTQRLQVHEKNSWMLRSFSSR